MCASRCHTIGSAMKSIFRLCMDPSLPDHFGRLRTSFKPTSGSHIIGSWPPPGQAAGERRCELEHRSPDRLTGTSRLQPAIRPMSFTMRKAVALIEDELHSSTAVPLTNLSFFVHRYFYELSSTRNPWGPDLPIGIAAIPSPEMWRLGEVET